MFRLLSHFADGQSIFLEMYAHTLLQNNRQQSHLLCHHGKENPFLADGGGRLSQSPERAFPRGHLTVSAQPHMNRQPPRPSSPLSTDYQGEAHCRCAGTTWQTATTTPALAVGG